jgi:predicted transcriptional regulator
MDSCLTFETGGDAVWFSQTTPYFSDYDSARSGDISDGQVSWMTTQVYGPGTLSFQCKISSGCHGDDIQFFIDGMLQNRLCETMEWHQRTYEITDTGVHTLEWRYIKESEADGGGWVCLDQFRWSGQTQVPPVITLSEALDTNLKLATGGAANWFSQTDTAFSGGDAARSGNVADNQESFLQTTVNGLGTISFYWKVSSEPDYDFLEFYIDGVIQDQISGLVDWQQKTYEITNSGQHILEWRYAKDVSIAENDDCGWVDLVKWP